MVKIKNTKLYSINFILLLFCSLASFPCKALFNFAFLKSAVQKHSELYEKFATERELTDIEVKTSLGGIVFETIKFKYIPETRNLLAYIAAFKNLDNKIMLNSIIKGFLVGLPIGLITTYRSFIPHNKNEKEFEKALVLGFIFSVLSVLHENKSFGKQPYFDLFLKKQDNYFSNISFNTAQRIFVKYISCIFGGTAGCVALICLFIIGLRDI